MKKEPTDDQKDPGVVLMDHEYDGIQEYDQRLPNWWLFTLYGAIAFSVVYWFFYFQSNVGQPDEQILSQRLAVIEAINLEDSLAMLDDDNLWRMSRNPQFVAAGQRHYESHCMACHGANLEGGIGFALNDGEWVRGGSPVEVYRVVEQGVAGTGMQAWGAILGPKRVAEVTAFVMSHHEVTAGGAAE